ncbi:MAG: DUF1289 domain-containing protein [Burkholderiales bacterium]|jgi:predicted Fe-S protein YdhL (DUF1289 family)
MNPASRPVRAAPPDPGDTTRPVRSPCVSICRIDAASGLCVGCQRTLDEIGDWGSMADGERLEVWARIVERREAGALSRSGA